MNVLNIADLLSGNPYPGRGIILGRSADNTCAVVAYFIMGRSANSRNRVFTTTLDGIRTEAADPAKLEDPSLIIYHPVRQFVNHLIVTNGDQTDTIRDGLEDGQSYIEALRTRCFEPDPPNYTPRISGILEQDGSYALSILKSFYGNPDCNNRYFYEYDNPQPGYGHFIHTYMGDGNPLPTFEGEPELVGIDCATAQEFSQLLWANLNEDNKVSLYVSYINLSTGKSDTVLTNKYEVTK
ncbi:MAG: IMP cyclohydrolase [Oscillospiraceae bacterium]|nr:IMP cyclohydrolase [Oscillospiraceae bacterium]